MGTPQFAVASLDALVSGGFEVVGVVTAPDRPAGRGQQVQMSAVKKYALNKSLPVLQPEKLKDPAFLHELRELRPDVQMVVAFRMLPEQIWDLPPMGTFNLHASLLPRYRGAAPINWAVINGEKRTGVTTFRLRHEIDSGGILLQQEVEIGPDDNAGELHDRLMTVGAALLVETARTVQFSMENNIPLLFSEQDISRVTHAPKIFRDDCVLNWAQPAEVVRNRIRGLSPHPGAFSVLVDDGKRTVIKIFQAVRTKDSSAGGPGSIGTDHRTYLHVQCGDGMLALQEIQAEGKKRMSVRELLNGFRIGENARFEITGADR